jgi:hypothetical protein
MVNMCSEIIEGGLTKVVGVQHCVTALAGDVFDGLCKGVLDVNRRVGGHRGDLHYLLQGARVGRV